MEPGERHSSRTVERVIEALRRRPRTTSQIMLSLKQQGWKYHLPSKNRLTNILSKNQRFTKLTFVMEKSAYGKPYAVALWCLTRRYKREQELVTKKIYSHLN